MSNDYLILDVGCGYGDSSLFWNNRGYCGTIFGLDNSLKKLDKVSAKSIIPVNHDLNNGNRLPFCDNHFDFVIMQDILEHLFYPESVLNDVNRVMKDNGKLYIHVPNDLNILALAKWVVMNDWRYYFPEKNEWDYPHIHFFTRNSIKRLLSKTGFRIVEDITKYDIPFFSKQFEVVSRGYSVIAVKE